MQPFLRTTEVLLQSFFRDRQSLFFTLALPLIFLFIFGFVFQGVQGERPVRITVYSTAEAKEELRQLLEELDGLLVEEVSSEEALQESLRSLQGDIGLKWDGTILETYTNPVRIQDNAYLEQVAAGILAKVNANRGSFLNLIQVEKEQVSDTSLGQLDYIFPGIIALGILSSGLFAISGAFMRYKDRKVLKRLLATPMHKVHFLLALMVTRMVASVASSGIVIVAGILIFDLQLTIIWWLFIPYLFIGTIIMMGFGSLVTLLAKTAENAVQISSILVTTMMFLSGIYFPLEFLPPVLKQLSAVLPLTYVAQGIRFTMGSPIMTTDRFVLMNLVLLSVALLLTWLVTVNSRWEES